jgi:hypothetical protein
MAAKLTYLPLDNIGINGVNTQANPTSLDPSWLVKADNIAFKESGRITFRSGVVQKVLPTYGTAISSIGEYKKTSSNGTVVDYELFCGTLDGTTNKISKVDITNAASAFTDAYTTSITANNWQFINFNNRLIALQETHEPLTYEGATWSTIKSGTGTSPDETGYTHTSSPLTKFDPDCGTGYYGRMWVGGVTETKDVLFYSDLLNETEWDAGSSGVIDLATVWGQDEIIAIEPFYGQLVIFGKHNIVIYSNPTEPNNMALVEVIRGIGCVARDTIQQVADDLFFLSSTGLRSLARTTEKDNVPLLDLSTALKDNIIRDIKSTSSFKSVYVEEEGLYILTFIDINIVYVFDMKHMTPAASPRVTFWDFKKSSFNIHSMINTETDGFLIGQNGGSLAKYEGYSDKEITSATPTLEYDDNQSYTGRFQTTWIDLGEGVTAALLKKLKAVIGGGANTDMSVKWDRDFGASSTNALTTQLNPPGIDYLYGVAKYSCNNDIDGFDYTSGDMCVYEDDGLAYVKYVEEVDPGDGEPLYVENTITSGSPIATRNEGSNYYFCHPLSAAPTTCESPGSEYASTKGLKEYNIPLSRAAKYVQFTFTAETGGSSTVLQDLTLLFKRGKIR